jgi:hypothetical protein
MKIKIHGRRPVSQINAVRVSALYAEYASHLRLDLPRGLPGVLFS